MKITESQLRKIIKSTLKEWSVYGSSYEPFESPYTEHTSQEPTEPISTSLKSIPSEEYEEDTCISCQGKGYFRGKECEACGGTGEIKY